MTTIGTPFTSSAKKVILCGSGELGKEVVMELQRYGVEVIALDAYENAPAMQVADRSYVVSMLDPDALRAIIEKESPDLIVPEVEAIATEVLVDLEREFGFTVIPTARATQLTMNREGIRSLAAEELKLSTSPYAFVDNFESFKKEVETLGMPCVVKPIMSSSGKGQSVVSSIDEVESAWKYAQEGGRAGAGKLIVEGFVYFDYEITLLTIRHIGGTSFCDPIGHVQKDGDYRESWQPHPMSKIALEKSQDIALKITDALGGFGLFGVELFIRGDEVYFSEVSPRPHDTGMVTMISQDLSEFSLHARAILGLPIPEIVQLGPSSSHVLLVEGVSKEIQYHNLDKALSIPGTQIRLFGKPEVHGKRRMGVALAIGESIEQAREKATKVIENIQATLS